MIDHSSTSADNTNPLDENLSKTIDPDSYLPLPAAYIEAYEIIKTAPDGVFYQHVIRKSIVRMFVGIALNLAILSATVIVFLARLSPD